MNRILLCDARLVDPEQPGEAPGALLVQDGRIEARIGAGEAAPGDARSIALGGARLAPGFLDVHFHGELPTGDARDTADALRRASASLVRRGVTAFLATTIAWPEPELADRLERIVEALTADDWPGAIPIGLHLEGPWIRAEAAGAQPPDGIRSYRAAEGAALFDRAGSLLRLVTLAPELAGARALESELVRRGVAIAVGHTLADEAALAASVANGARHATHLFNAMGAHNHRSPMLLRSAIDAVPARILAEQRLGFDLIADGVHVHPDWLAAAVRAGRDRAILISDRIDVPAGAGDGWLGADRMHSDGVAWRLPDGRLAGSLLTLDDAIRNVERWRVMSPHDAIAACTVRPARLIGAERERGSLRAGARADLVALGEKGAVLATWVGGRLAHVGPSAPAALRG